MGKKNPANAPSRQPDYVKAPEGLCAATVLTACCSATFRLRLLYAAAIQEDQVSKDMPPDSLLDLICKGLAENYTTKKARTALGLPGGF